MKTFALLLIAITSVTPLLGQRYYEAEQTVLAEQLRQIAQGSATSTTSVAATPALPINKDQTLIVICGTWGSGAATLSLADTQAATITAIGNTSNNSSDFDSSLWAWKVIPVGNSMDMLTCSGGSAGSHMDIGIVDLGNNPVVDVSNFGNVNNSSSGNTRSMTTTTTDRLILAVVSADGSSDVYSGTSGYLAEITGVGTSGDTFKIYDKENVAAGSQSVTVTGTQTHPQHAAFIAIRQ